MLRDVSWSRRFQKKGQAHSKLLHHTTTIIISVVDIIFFIFAMWSSSFSFVSNIILTMRGWTRRGVLEEKFRWTFKTRNGDGQGAISSSSSLLQSSSSMTRWWQCWSGEGGWQEERLNLARHLVFVGSANVGASSSFTLIWQLQHPNTRQTFLSQIGKKELAEDLHGNHIFF